MNSNKITHVTPLHGTILLAVLENQLLKKRDVKLLIDIRGTIWPPKHEPDPIIEIAWPEGNELSENCVEVTFEIDEVLLNDVQNWCAEIGVAIEQLTIAFLRFCAHCENYGAVRDWLAIGKGGNG